MLQTGGEVILEIEVQNGATALLHLLQTEHAATEAYHTRSLQASYFTSLSELITMAASFKVHIGSVDAF